MPKKYPPLTPTEVRRILLARGFTLIRTRGSHYTYQALLKGKKRSVTVDDHFPEYDDELLKNIVSQSGMDREEFYGSTKETARKIDLHAESYPIPLK